MLTQQIALVPEMAGVNLAEISRVGAAMQRQVVRDFAPIWGSTATIDVFPHLEDVPVGYWPLLVVARQLGSEEGIHIDSEGQPYGLVEMSPGWSVMASHICLEMLTNPFGSRTVTGSSPRPDQGPVQFLLETCAPCESFEFAYLMHDVLVSDFTTPAYWEPVWPKTGHFSFTGAIRGMRELLPGGHFTWYDPVTECWWLRTVVQGVECDVRLPFDDVVPTTVRETIASCHGGCRSTKMTLDAFEMRTGAAQQRSQRASQVRAHRLRTALAGGWSDGPRLQSGGGAVGLFVGADEAAREMEEEISRAIELLRTPTDTCRPQLVASLLEAASSAPPPRLDGVEATPQAKAGPRGAAPVAAKSEPRGAAPVAIKSESRGAAAVAAKSEPRGAAAVAAKSGSRAEGPTKAAAPVEAPPVEESLIQGPLTEGASNPDVPVLYDDEDVEASFPHFTLHDAPASHAPDPSRGLAEEGARVSGRPRTSVPPPLPPLPPPPRMPFAATPSVSGQPFAQTQRLGTSPSNSPVSRTASPAPHVARGRLLIGGGSALAALLAIAAAFVLVRGNGLNESPSIAPAGREPPGVVAMPVFTSPLPPAPPPPLMNLAAMDSAAAPLPSTPTSATPLSSTAAVVRALTKRAPEGQPPTAHAGVAPANPSRVAPNRQARAAHASLGDGEEAAPAHATSNETSESDPMEELIRQRK